MFECVMKWSRRSDINEPIQEVQAKLLEKVYHRNNCLIFRKEQKVLDRKKSYIGGKSSLIATAYLM